MPRKRRRRTGIAVSGGRGRPSRLASASLAELQAELARRERVASELGRRRDQLLAELATLDRELTGSGAARRGGRRGRPVGQVVRRGRPGRRGGGRGRGGRRRARNATNLVEALRGVLSNATMSVTDAAKAVQRAGYRTTSANFRTIVNQALLGNKGHFKKVSRGQYTAKG
jgi:hypothetical protein